MLKNAHVLQMLPAVFSRLLSKTTMTSRWREDVMPEPWCVCVCVMECLLFFFLSGIRCEILSYSNVCMCFNVRLPQCNQNTSVWRWLRSVWIKCCVWGKNVVCVCVLFILPGLFPLPNNLGNNLSGETNYISSQGFSFSVSLCSLHILTFRALSKLFSSPFASFCTLFCLFISYFFSLPPCLSVLC